MIEICTVGGYDEIGKNMTAINVDGTVVVLDMGLHLEPYIEYANDDDVKVISVNKLLEIQAVPDIGFIRDWKKKVKVIVPTHAHLDHVGAIPFISNRFEADILCTPFTAEVIKSIVKDEKIKLKNKIKVVCENSKYTIDENVTLEFINITHSTPQTVMVALHTKYGTLLYANDFKLDNQPILGRKANMKRLTQLGKEGILCLIVDTTGAEVEAKTPSEMIAKELLKQVLLETYCEDKAVIVTTFSSHLARLKSIIEFGKKMKRKVILLGRSLSRYISAAENIGLVNFSDEAEIVRYGNKIKRRLKRIMKEGKEKYLIVCTGHQGEPGSVLSRIVSGQYPFELSESDHVVFSCRVIPCPVNEEAREELENALRKKNVRIFKDIHVSGHAAKEDLYDILEILKPQHIIPAHGNNLMKGALAELAVKMGYRMNKNIHLMSNGERIVLTEKNH